MLHGEDAPLIKSVSDRDSTGFSGMERDREILVGHGACTTRRQPESRLSSSKALWESKVAHVIMSSD